MRNVQKANTVAPMAATSVVLVWRTKHVTTIQDSVGMTIPKKRRGTALVDTPANNATCQYAQVTVPVLVDSVLDPTNAFAQIF